MADDREGLRLFLSQRRELVRYTTAIIGDPGEAEDIVQEAWLRFSEALKRSIVSEPRGLLFRIARNLALDGRRRKGFEQRVFRGDALDSAGVIASDEPSAHVHLEASNELELVRGAIARLPERTRTAFMLHRFEGLRLVDIAARLGISKSLAHELVTDGVEQCRKALKRRP